MRFFVVSSVLAALVGCGGGDGGPGPGPVPADITLNASTTGTVNALNATRTLTATVRDANQDVISNPSVTWSASPTGVVNLSSTSGLTTTVTAVGNGSTTITATAGTVTATHNVTVAQSFQSLGQSPRRTRGTSHPRLHQLGRKLARRLSGRQGHRHAEPH